MKTIGEILLGYTEDPDKERIRQRILDDARAWEESEPQPEPTVLPPPPPRDPSAADPLEERMAAALPRLSPVQRQTLGALLDSWGM